MRHDRARARIPTLGPRGEGWVLLQGLLLATVGVSGLATVAGVAALPRTAEGMFRIVLAGVGLVLIVLGAEQARRGVRDLGRNLTPLPYPTDRAQLVETGIYRRVRHPIYGGLILMSIGWAHLTASLAALVVAAQLIPFFWLKYSLEERWLESRFDGYAAYRRRTRRFIAWPG